MEVYSFTDLMERTAVSKHSLKFDVSTVNAPLILIPEDFFYSQQEKSILTIQSKLGLIFFTSGICVYYVKMYGFTDPPGGYENRITRQ